MKFFQKKVNDDEYQENENGDDYHDNDAISNNCLRDKEINQLEKEGKCVTITHGGSEQLQWERCIKKLSKTVDQKCHGLGLSEVKSSFGQVNPPFPEILEIILYL